VTVLLDVNVVIALIDPTHVHHDLAHRWFGVRSKSGWATCPIVENGCVRIVSNPKYSNAQPTPRSVIESLRSLRSVVGFQFWPDSLCLIDDPSVDSDAILGSRQVTHTYLLALAVSRKGSLATFDRKLMTTSVVGGAAALELIGP
jgi:toxin-antitoxin system PIN domain toxin